MNGDHIRVLRLEHKCSEKSGHGPTYYCQRLQPSERPPFGYRGSGPFNIQKHEQCGVTAEQMPAWFDSNPLGYRLAELTRWYAAGWRWQLYEVPLEEAHYDNNQVVFTARPEYRVRTMRRHELLAHNLIPLAEEEYNRDHSYDVATV